ncbi:MAG: hypothetical protein ACR2QT_13605 [Woeseiaceae bacterium]
MVWKIDYQEDSQIVELSFSGRISGAELKEAAAARIEFGNDKGIRKYLIDATEMLAPKSTIFDVLEIPAKVYSDKLMDRSSNIAVVQPTDPDSQWIAEFYGNASVMRGWKSEIFSDRESAIAWLQALDR